MTFRPRRLRRVYRFKLEPSQKQTHKLYQLSGARLNLRSSSAPWGITLGVGGGN